MTRKFRLKRIDGGFGSTIFDWNHLPQMLFPGNFILEYCTERLDINGKEIYEGDTLLFLNKTTKGICQYSPSEAAFIVTYSPDLSFVYLGDFDNWEII